jgi:hypothetical protein
VVHQRRLASFQFPRAGRPTGFIHAFAAFPKQGTGLVTLPGSVSPVLLQGKRGLNLLSRGRVSPFVCVFDFDYLEKLADD